MLDTVETYEVESYQGVRETNTQSGYVGAMFKQPERHDRVPCKLGFEKPKENDHGEPKHDQTDHLSRVPRECYTAKLEADQEGYCGADDGDAA